MKVVLCFPLLINFLCPAEFQCLTVLAVQPHIQTGWANASVNDALNMFQMYLRLLVTPDPDVVVH